MRRPRDPVILLAAAGWTLFVWLTRIGNILGDDRSTAFKVVHVALAAVSVTFALLIAAIGWRALRDRSH